jgi:hypothetical protein
MNLNDLFTEEKVRLDPKCWTGKKIGNPKTKMKGGVRVNNCVPAESINEFASPGDDDREPNEEEILRQLAAQWWLGTEQQMAKAQRTLEVMGWEIGQDESGDDDAGVFLIRPGDENGDSYIAFNHSDLEDLAESLTEMDKSQTPPGRDGSNDSDAGKKEYTATPTTPGAVARQGGDILNKAFKDSQRVDPRTGKKMNIKGVAEGQLDEKSTSQAQFRTMAAAAHDPEFAQKVGIKQSVAKEFNQADKGQDYKSLPKKADESKSAPKEKEADYGDDYQDMVARVKKLAGLGPLKTVYDPAKRVYRNVPTAVQPKK